MRGPRTEAGRRLVNLMYQAGYAPTAVESLITADAICAIEDEASVLAILDRDGGWAPCHCGKPWWDHDVHYPVPESKRD